MLKYGERRRAWSRGETALHFGMGPDRFMALIQAHDVATLRELREMRVRSDGEIERANVRAWEDRNIE